MNEEIMLLELENSKLLVERNTIRVYRDQLEKKCWKLGVENAILRLGIRAVLDLIEESRGVAGLHRNGDLAEWESLRTGGQFEVWLAEFDRAAALLPEIPKEEEEG